MSTSQTAVPRIAVFASGRGSNFEAVLRAIEDGKLRAQIVALVCDRPGAPVMELAKDAGIPVLLVPPPPATASGGASAEIRRVNHDRAIWEKLKAYQPRFLVLAGYMRILSGWMIDTFRSERGYSRIVNVHPSLLPSFPGKESYRQAFEHGAQLAGVTVHLVDPAVDSGPICAQESFAIADCTTPEQVEKRGLAVEHRLYPATLDWVLSERFGVTPLSSRRIRVRPH